MDQRDTFEFFATSTMDHLIHSGRADLAWQFFDQAWPRGWPGKASMEKELRARVSASRWYAELRRMQSLPHTPPLDTDGWLPILTSRD